jgi:hypothetical protein
LRKKIEISMKKQQRFNNVFKMSTVPLIHIRHRRPLAHPPPAQAALALTRRADSLQLSDLQVAISALTFAPQVAALVHVHLHLIRLVAPLRCHHSPTIVVDFGADAPAKPHSKSTTTTQSRQ